MPGRATAAGATTGPGCDVPGPESDEDPQVWVRSDVMPDGTYRAVVEFDEDTTRVLTVKTATTYALAILDAVQAAEHDAAVFRQLTASGLELEAVGAFIAADLRPTRRPLRPTGFPLTVTPGVSHRDHRGFLTLAIGDTKVGQWELADAREHARFVLEAVLAVDYDTSYHRALVVTVGLTDAIARASVQDIANYREPKADA